MRRFGFWRGAPLIFGRAERIEEWVRPAGPLPDADRVAGYLEGADSVCSLSGMTFEDHLTGEEVSGGESLRTDGEWVWPHTLGHYVRRRALGLPEEFLARIRELGYRPPELPGELVRAIGDETFEELDRGPRSFPPGGTEQFLGLLGETEGFLDADLVGDARDLAERGDLRGAWATL